MIKNYFTTALRNFKKNKLNTFLNIFGLGVGMACCLFVFTITNYENSFDAFHSKSNDIYRVTKHYHGDYGISHIGMIPYPTGDAIINDIPDFKEVIQIHGPIDEKVSFTDGFDNQQVFREDKVLFTESSFFDAFDYRILRGASAAILNEPYKAFITERLSDKFFGKNNPVGKVITINQTEKIEIAGVVETPPDNTNHPFEIIVSLPTLRLRHPNMFTTQWGMTWAYSAYVVIPENRSVAELEAKLDQMMLKYLDEDDDKDKTKMHLQPLKEVHTDERYGVMTYNTPALLMTAFLVLGALIMGTACLNFINLSTAQAIKRAKEIGIRKTLGSNKAQLIAQFMIETFAVVFAAMIIAFTLGQIFIQQFNSFLTIIEYNLSYSHEVIGFSAVLALIITFLAGFYPSLILAGYQPVEALNNQINVKKGSGNLNLRRTLVIAQLAFTNIMLISTVIIAAQMNYVKNSDLGFNAENVVTINFPDGSHEKLESIAKEFETKSYVSKVAKAYTPPFASNNWNSSYGKKGEEMEDGNNANRKFADENYIHFYEIPLIAGSNISGRYLNDSISDGLVTRKLVESLGWTPEESVGQWISIGSEEIKIVGVVENFNNRPLTMGMKSTIIASKPTMMEQLSIKIAGGNATDHRDDLEATFRSFYPDELFEFSVLQDDINQQYIVENILQTVLSVVAALCILLSVMGLYGLVSFMANRNAKTIGIRKVFGASIIHILTSFAKEYCLLLIVSFIISAPIAYFMMDIWLAEFAYRIEPGLLYFGIAFILSFIIAMSTVGYRSYRAASVNPIRSLRYE